MTKEMEILHRLQNEVATEVKEVVEEKRKEEKVKKRSSEEWDVKIGDPIDYFDPTLSYEITGYRPIDQWNGLDFDPSVFMEAGNRKLKDGHYCTYPDGSPYYDKFWAEEIRRCEEGMTVGKYTITGDNYFFLNYFRLKKATRNERTGLDEQVMGFPNFQSIQYTWFHYFRLCELLRMNAVALKPRGVGWSMIAASMGARVYSIVRESNCIYAAAADGQLKPTFQVVSDELEYLNQETDGGLAHLKGVDKEYEKRSTYKIKDKDTLAYVEKGFKSSIVGRVIDDPNKMRGTRVQRLFLEEAGSNKQLLKAFIQGEALLTTNGIRIGIQAAWGTGGDNGPQLDGLRTLFYDPNAFNVLPFKNNFNERQEECFTAFFIPYYKAMAPFMDSRGVCDEQKAKEFEEKARARLANNPKELLRRKAEFCFTPEDVFMLEGEQRFDADRLSEQMTNIELLKRYNPPKNGYLTQPLNPETGKVDFKLRPTFTPDNTGKIKVVEYPMTDDSGIPYSNLYVAGIDSIDADESTSSGQNDVSDFCIVVYKRIMGLQAPKIVSIYKDRPRDVRQAYNTAIKLCRWYNCQAVVESSRVGIISHFKQNECLDLLARRPMLTISGGANAQRNPRTPIKQFGVIPSENNIMHANELIDDFIADYCETIDYREVIDELLRYSYEMKRKFDIVAALGMALMGDEDMRIRNSMPRQIVKQNTWRDVGYYIDEYGYRKYGVIPDERDKIGRRSPLDARGYL